MGEQRWQPNARAGGDGNQDGVDSMAGDSTMTSSSSAARSGAASDGIDQRSLTMVGLYLDFGIFYFLKLIFLSDDISS
jgi:hypothetical protein